MTQILLKNPPVCALVWGNLSLSAWEKYYRQVPRAPMLQAWSYGDAMARQNQQRVRRGLITLNGEPAGLVQILEAGLLSNAVHGVILDRGPIWFEGYGSAEDFLAFLEAFRKDFPKRFGRRIRFLPEMPKSIVIEEILEARQFRKKGLSGYRTLWKDIRPDGEKLMASMHKKWRSSLRKALAEDMDIVWDVRGTYLSWVLDEYTKDRGARGYNGPSAAVMQALAGAFVPGENMLIGLAKVDNRPIAAIVLFIHGAAATYQIGVSSDLGRRKCAHFRLLWEVMEVLKRRGVQDFDLGGIDDQGAAGVTSFKEGMGGQVYETVGFFN